jgi:hypothetical protein
LLEGGFGTGIGVSEYPASVHVGMNEKTRFAAIAPNSLYLLLCFASLLLSRLDILSTHGGSMGLLL